MALKVEDLHRFYVAKKISGNCPVCGTNDWQFADPPAGYRWAIPSSSEGPNLMLPTPALPLAILACSNCYHVRVHAALPIQEWLDKNPTTP